MASSCIACCIFHIISTPFNCSDTALRVTDAKIGPKFKMFVFRYVCFVSQIWRQNSYPGSLTFLHLGNRAEIYEGISMKKFNNLKVKRVKSNLKYTESKLVKKKTTVKGRNSKKVTIIWVSHRKRQHAKRHHAKRQHAKRNRKKGNLQKGIT